MMQLFALTRVQHLQNKPFSMIGNPILIKYSRSLDSISKIQTCLKGAKIVTCVSACVKKPDTELEHSSAAFSVVFLIFN